LEVSITMMRSFCTGAKYNVAMLMRYVVGQDINYDVKNVDHQNWSIIIKWQLCSRDTHINS